MSAAESWVEELEGWRIPDEIMAQAPEPPWGFPPHLFTHERIPEGDLHRAARAALGPGGAVLDVGCGGGAASVPLAPPAVHLTGFDSSPAMLDTYAAAAETAGVAHTEILGDWVTDSGRAGAADVVVCRNVVYNVSNIVPFVAALTEHASRRIFVELTESHPLVDLGPLWVRFWNLPRPDGPSADLFAEVLAEMGIEPETKRQTRPSTMAHVEPHEHVAFVRQRLCLDESRDPDIAEALSGVSRETTAVVMSWSP